MVIEGFRDGWRAGVQDTGLGAAVGQAVRSGDLAGAGQAVANVAERAGNVARNMLGRLSEGVLGAASSLFSNVGATDMARGADRARNELRAGRHEGQAQSSLQKAGSYFKRAFESAFRAYSNPSLKGVGANLTFSVASWGSNMKESLKNLGCAIGDGFKSLGERIKSWF